MFMYRPLQYIQYPAHCKYSLNTLQRYCELFCTTCTVISHIIFISHMLSLSCFILSDMIFNAAAYFLILYSWFLYLIHTSDLKLSLPQYCVYSFHTNIYLTNLLGYKPDWLMELDGIWASPESIYKAQTCKYNAESALENNNKCKKQAIMCDGKLLAQPLPAVLCPKIPVARWVNTSEEFHHKRELRESCHFPKRLF